VQGFPAFRNDTVFLMEPVHPRPLFFSKNATGTAIYPPPLLGVIFCPFAPVPVFFIPCAVTNVMSRSRFLSPEPLYGNLHLVGARHSFPPFFAPNRKKCLLWETFSFLVALMRIVGSTFCSLTSLL